MSGSEFRTFILELPASDHKVDAVDAQPILATIQADGNCAVLVVASGTVKYKPEAKSRRFVCNFVVTPTGPNGSLQVDSEDFRFV
ncbi:hypothetical protein BC828DRAFT_392524 [Blastocladiella britannica]|nr:hypothetical protein BC828DRAFT_392524 [Blastocladiella britannica]